MELPDKLVIYSILNLNKDLLLPWKNISVKMTGIGISIKNKKYFFFIVDTKSK